MNVDASIADDDLIAAFESAALPAEGWNHRAHVRVAFILARRECDFTTAIARMRAGLYALNIAHCVPDEPSRGYHETITVAFMRLIYAACARQLCPSSVDFCERHPELLKKDALLAYFSPERLASTGAKVLFIEPDLKPLPS